ncbi:hypothetical protein OS190_11525 [Sulfitobacter sp. F26204]|uniref:hypothetical protein n=1 Tax=Sulfitobacter sp. F26204 TaxID=2996014 RepID=UPI00225E3AE7|nr:hypothetical protein [Sulfitobacter sp. F26204]MCX7560200.1 hypothetical protein [Sulfitobacter sp. F26204]
MEATDPDACVPEELIQLGTYAWPRSQTRQTLGHLIQKIKTGLGSRTGEDAIDPDRLKSVSDETYEAKVRQALSRVLHTMLDKEYLAWITSVKVEQPRRLFVHPPMENDILTEWATQNDIPILLQGGVLSDFFAQGRVVIPRLDAFFVRDQNRLGLLFDLLDQLSRFDGQVLIGCNSWAWRFLQQFDDASMVLGEAKTFPAFDADALAALLRGMSDAAENCISVASGEPVLKRNAKQELCDPFLENLAALSLGIPWVAIEMFLRGIAETKETKETKDAVSDDHIWVDLPNTSSLPSSGAAMLKFALHALLIHGPREIDALNNVLPQRVPNGIWLELNRLGFVAMRDGRVSPVICRYPDIRSELGAAGFNLDKL